MTSLVDNDRSSISGASAAWRGICGGLWVGVRQGGNFVSYEGNLRRVVVLYGKM